ncbi:hypothetical protein [Bradyrhizobium elkanii]|uniref:hypothetical protein n=1 Tax=Bradyrhizobium elkanii TaxID=29448 RepID=UPI0035161D8C
MQREAVHRRAGISLNDNEMQNPGSDAGVFVWAWSISLNDNEMQNPGSDAGVFVWASSLAAARPMRILCTTSR